MTDGPRRYFVWTRDHDDYDLDPWTINSIHGSRSEATGELGRLRSLGRRAEVFGEGFDPNDDGR